MLQRTPDSASDLLVDLEPGPGTGNAPRDLEVAGEDHRTLAHVTVDRRSRLRLPLAQPFPTRLHFLVHQAGLPTDRDPRIMNFRAFRFEWEHRPRSQHGADSASLKTIRRRNLVVTVWFALQHLIDRLAKGGRLARLTGPVSPRMRRLLKSYPEWRALRGTRRTRHPP